MTIPIRNSVSFKLARASVIVTFLVGIVLSSVQVFLDFKNENATLGSTIQHILKVAQTPAVQAAYRLDETMSSQLVRGLLVYDFIVEAELKDEFDNQLAIGRNAPEEAGGTSWITRSLGDQFAQFQVQLHDPDDPELSYGQLAVVVDRDIALSPFFNRALYVFGSGVARNFLFALLLFTVFYFLLAKPMAALAAMFARIDPGAPGSPALSGLRGHEQDELGLLVKSGNDFLDASRRTQEELRTSEQQLRAIMDNSPANICLRAINGGYLMVNKAFSDRLKVSTDDAKGMTIYDLVDKNLADTLADYDREVLETRRPNQHEQEVTYPDGRRQINLVVKFPIFGPDNEPVAIGTIASDVTARKEAEERVRRYFDLPLVGAAIYGPDKKWIEVNDKLCELLGYSREELAELTWVDVTHPDDRAENLRLFEEASTGQRDTYTLDKRFVRKDGQILNAIALAECVRHPSGKPDYFIALVQDITERQRATQALRESEGRYRALYNNTPAMLHSIDNEGRLVSVSDYWLSTLGYERDEVLGRKAVEFCTPEARKHAVEVAIPMLMRTGNSFNNAYQFVKKNGEVLDILLSATAERSDSGEFLRSLAVLTDVTELRRAQEELARHRDRLEELVQDRTKELEAAQQSLMRTERLAALGQLTATVSHELRNPLGSMRTSIAVIKKVTTGDYAPLVTAVEIVDSSITRCDNIIGDLLDFSRTRELERQPTAIDAWLSQTLDEYALPQGITLSRRLESDAEVSFDQDRLRRVLINVLDNARDAMVDDTAIELDGRQQQLDVVTRVADHRYEFVVTDSGKGVDPDHLAQIFEPLFSTKSFGVGLGLPTVKQIMEQHGGGVEFTSEPDQGSRVVLWLPMDDSEPETPSV